MQIDPPNARSWLESEFNRRRSQNERYSLRMLARKLDIPSGRLSELMSGRRQMTKRVAMKIANRLLLSPIEREKLFRLAEKGLDNGDAANAAQPSDSEFTPLSTDSFHALADWYHFAILSLIKTDDFESKPKWIASRLGISPVQARTALARLARLGLIKVENNRWIREAGHLTTTNDLESVALKLSHRQSLEQSIAALDDVPVEFRDITSVTLPVDLKRLPRAKQMIKKFRRELSAFLEEGSSKDEVFNINIQLVPVTKIGKSKRSDQR